MKCNQTLHRILLATLAGICTVPFAAFPSRAGAADRQTNPHDLMVQAKVFDNHSKDFSAMQQAVHGEEFEILEFLQQVAVTAEDRLNAANAEIQMYDGMTCSGDRVKAKAILTEQLRYYIWAFDGEVTRVNGALTFLKVPAEAQAGLQMKNDLRVAKEKLEAVLASLTVTR